MSYIITIKVAGDTAAFSHALAERGDEFAKFVSSSQAHGAIHHRFGVGDGFVLVVDEWESPAEFEKFFSDPELQAFIATTGADMSLPPEVTVVEAVESADQY
jgi:quinol monooxygenase YgiN